MSILDLLYERELTPEQKAARRARAKARRERAKAEKPAKEVSDKLEIGDDEWAMSQWEKLNKIYFEGKLKRPRLGVNWSRSMRSRGRCRNDFDPRKNEVFTLEIQLNSKSFDSYSSFRNTLVHEMVHQWFYEQLNENDIRYANRYGMARSRKWWAKLTADAGRDGHHGRWLQKAEVLNGAHKELSLSKFSSEDQFEVSSADLEKRMTVSKKAHVLIRVFHRLGRDKRYFYYVTDECFNNLKEALRENRMAGPWTEYDFDPQKMAMEIKEPLRYIGNQCYKIGYFKDLCERGIIKEWSGRRVSGEEA